MPARCRSVASGTPVQRALPIQSPPTGLLMQASVANMVMLGRSRNCARVYDVASLCSANIQLPSGFRHHRIDGVFRNLIEVFRRRDFVAPFGGLEENAITANQSRDNRHSNRNHKYAPRRFRRRRRSVKSPELQRSRKHPVRSEQHEARRQCTLRRSRCKHPLPCQRNQDENVKPPHCKCRIERVAQIRSNAIPVASEKYVRAEVSDRDSIECEFLRERPQELNREFNEGTGKISKMRFASSSGMKMPPPIFQRSTLTTK